MRISIGQRLASLNGIGPGFDHLRIGLALTIFTWHCFSISYGADYGARLHPVPGPPFLAALLPMFFGLSGFLVMGSALRTADVKTFITLRVLRIVPALFTELLLSAFVLGPLLTALSPRQYFHDPMFLEYLGSLVGRVRFQLPGLFLDNPTPLTVNYALWTVGPEILCYIILALLMMTGLFCTGRRVFTVALAYTIVAILSAAAFYRDHIGAVLPGKLLILSFLLGNLIYLWKDRIPFSGRLGALSYVVGLALIAWAQASDIEIPLYAALPLLIYALVNVGLLKLPRLPFFHRGDYSYGVYLFGFPIQQSIAHFLPNHREWYISLAIGLPLVLLMGVASWHLIEKPALGLRKRILAPRSANNRPGQNHIAIKCGYASVLVLYGAFVFDAANILPTRDGVKMMLWGFGLYHYDDNDRRPSFLKLGSAIGVPAPSGSRLAPPERSIRPAISP